MSDSNEKQTRNCPCTICTPKNIVPCKGIDAPDVYILGEAPGADEVENRTPFIGQAGQVLRSALKIAGLTSVRVGNTCLCRPTTISKAGGICNRTPTDEEIMNCFEQNAEQDLISHMPRKGLLVLGRSAAYAVTRNDRIKIGSIYGNEILSRYNCYVYAYYHPSYLMRIQNDKQGTPLFDKFVTLLTHIKDRQ